MESIVPNSNKTGQSVDPFAGSDGKKVDRSAPIVIGGVGGSGTRVLADILMELGFHMGEVRQEDNDNLWFAGMFFSRPDWFVSFSIPERARFFIRAFGVFEKLTFSQFGSKLRMLEARMRALLFVAFSWHPLSASRLLAVFREGLPFAFKAVSFSRRTYADYVGWGWKEPVSHIYLEYLCEHFGRIKYIHLTREGLDMAFSKNMGQLEIWGKLFDISIPDVPKMLPKAALNYWIAANARAIELGRRLLGRRFMVLKFEDICHFTRREIEKLLSFLDLDSNAVNVNRLCELVRTPDSIGRYKRHDLSIFNRDELAATKKIEYLIDHQ